MGKLAFYHFSIDTFHLKLSFVRSHPWHSILERKLKKEGLVIDIANIFHCHRINLNRFSQLAWVHWQHYATFMLHLPLFFQLKQ